MSYFGENKKLLMVVGVALLLVVIVTSLSGNKQSDVPKATLSEKASVSISEMKEEKADAEKKSVPVEAIWDVSLGEGKDEYVSIETMSQDLVQAWIKKTHPRLIIECREKKTNVLFNIGTSFTLVGGQPDKAAVTYSLGKDKPVPGYWQKNAKGDAVIAPEPIKFLKSIKSARKIMFESTPFNAKTASVEFDLRGIEMHLEDISEACGWEL